MSEQVSVRCPCGQQAVADAKDLGQQAVCAACGKTFLLWPDEAPTPGSQGDWHLKVGAQVMGPFQPADLRKFVGLGRIRPDTLVRKGADGKWLQAVQVKGLLDGPGANPPGGSAATAPAGAGRMAHPGRKRAAPSASRSAHGGASKRTSAGARQAAVRSKADARLRSRPPASGDLAATLSRHPFVVLSMAIGGIAIAVFILLLVKQGHEDEQRAQAEQAEAEQQQEAEAREAAKQVAAAAAAAATPAPPERLTTQEIAARSLESVAVIQGHNSTGTGFLIEPNLLATNRHVIEQELMSHVRVQFPDTTKRLRGLYGAKLLYEDPELDMAFLQVEIELPPLPLAAKHDFVRGEEITVIGSPGLDGGQVVANAISRGLLSTTSDIGGVTYYQLGIAVNPGNSGGPVFNEYGDVIGVVTLKSSYLEGMAWCIPLASLRESLARAKAATLSDIAITRANHRLEVAAIGVARAGYYYSLAMMMYVSAMQLATLQKDDMNAALTSARSAVADRLMAINGSMMLELGEQAPKILVDESLSEASRRRFASLWSNYVELKDHVDSPRGTLDTYSAKCEALSSQRQELLSLLKGLDGIDAGEELR